LQRTPEELSDELRHLVRQLQAAGRNDLLLRAITVPVLEELRIEAARGRLSHLEITADYRFLLTDYGKEVDLDPVHKAVYLLFLRHEEGIEFKRLADYRSELLYLYKETANRMDYAKIVETVDRLTDPTDNAINEKCSRIKRAFLSLMDEYSASYYVISSHTRRHIEGTASAVWFERLKSVSLPRHLVSGLPNRL